MCFQQHHQYFFFPQMVIMMSNCDRNGTWVFEPLILMLLMFQPGIESNLFYASLKTFSSIKKVKLIQTVTFQRLLASVQKHQHSYFFIFPTSLYSRWRYSCHVHYEAETLCSNFLVTPLRTSQGIFFMLILSQEDWSTSISSQWWWKRQKLHQQAHKDVAPGSRSPMTEEFTVV